MKIKILLITLLFAVTLAFAQSPLNYEAKGDTLYLIVNDSTLIRKHVAFIYERKVPKKSQEAAAKKQDEAELNMPTEEHYAEADSANREVVSVYHRLDPTDDLEETHPAADLYANLWQKGDVNPYRIPLDSIPDSTLIDLTGYTIPVPLPGYVTSKFGPRRYRYHYGTDLKLQIGDTVRAAWDGQIRYTKYNPGGYGYYIVIRHPNGLETVYGHLARILVIPNQYVKSGEAIALGGSTGRSTGPHLHFETRYLGNPINSETFFDYTLRQTHNDSYLITKKNTHLQQKSIQDLGSAKYYTIKKGDTLGLIARRNGTSVKNLCRLNGIKETTILQIGKRIRVR